MAATATPTFEVLADWGDWLPDLRRQDVSDVAVDASDTVYLLYRAPSFVEVCTTKGEHRATWGAGVLSNMAHGITVGADGRVYVVDVGHHCVYVFDPSGERVETLGSGPTNPAFASEVTGEFIDHIPRAFPPFTRPTKLAEASSGEVYVSDGYGNCRLHRYSADHRLLQSWGEPGVGPGEFHIPHNVHVDRDGRVLVCDRENDRVQVFDADGRFLEQWTDFHRPQALVEGPDGRYYVAEGAWRKGHVSPRNGPVGPASSCVSVVDRDGRVVSRTGGDDPSQPGNFLAAHGIAVDSRGDVYVAEVSTSVRARFFPDLEKGLKTLQKLRRTG